MRSHRVSRESTASRDRDSQESSVYENSSTSLKARRTSVKTAKRKALDGANEPRAPSRMALAKATARRRRLRSRCRHAAPPFLASSPIQNEPQPSSKNPRRRVGQLRTLGRDRGCGRVSSYWNQVSLNLRTRPRCPRCASGAAYHAQLDLSWRSNDNKARSHLELPRTPFEMRNAARSPVHPRVPHRLLILKLSVFLTPDTTSSSVAIPSGCPSRASKASCYRHSLSVVQEARRARSTSRVSLRAALAAQPPRVPISIHALELTSRGIAKRSRRHGAQYIGSPDRHPTCSQQRIRISENVSCNAAIGDNGLISDLRSPIPRAARA